MAVVYYPKGQLIAQRDTLSASYETIVLATNPQNAVIYFDPNNNIHALSASVVSMTASYAISSSAAVNFPETASNANTASLAFVSVSSSYATTSSYVLNGASSSYSVTASYALNAETASYAQTAVTASFFNNGGSGVGLGINGMLYLTSSYVWTVPRGITKARVIAIGAGGGGGGSGAGYGGGGGGGGYCEGIIDFTGMETVSFTVGIAGTGSNFFGQSGSLSGVLNITASGGGGAIYGTVTPGPGGAGGGATGGTVMIKGLDGLSGTSAFGGGGAPASCGMESSASFLAWSIVINVRNLNINAINNTYGNPPTFTPYGFGPAYVSSGGGADGVSPSRNGANGLLVAYF